MKFFKYSFIKICFLCFGTFALHAQKIEIKENELLRILNTLASDEMRGRSALTPDIEMAADFISAEFQRIGLQSFQNNKNYRQPFEINSVTVEGQAVSINGKTLAENDFIIEKASEEMKWTPKNTEVDIQIIDEKDAFSEKYRNILSEEKELNQIIFVHPAHRNYFSRVKQMRSSGQLEFGNKSSNFSKVFVLLEKEELKDYSVVATKKRKPIKMNNIVGLLPGKSKPEEYVIFSGHYDHIGILPSVKGDSIANGADDDASGITAVISLAEHFKKLNNNERSILFVAFTAEELGLIGSNYFGTQIDPEKVIAMINIEMIGKDAKFGPNSLYVTGSERSNLSELMQNNIKDDSFKFEADPYIRQNLFYRSDNASLAAIGVPAHTFSTVQIDNDSLYHSVGDEVETLDVDNIKSSIIGIIKGTSGIINGKQTPTRVEKLRE